MRPGVIDHRNPADRHYLGVLGYLRKRSKTARAGAIALIAIGTPLLFIGPLMLGSIFWFATWNLVGYYPWTWFFIGAVVVVIPSLFAGEMKQRGGWTQTANLDNSRLVAMDDGGEPITPWESSSIFADLLMNPRAATSGFLEVFLAGPRLVLDGAAKLRRARQLSDVSLERAADIICRLSSAEGGVRIRSLLRDGEVPEDLVRVLALLVFQDLIGVSTQGGRAWLLSDARQRLLDQTP